MGYAPVMAMPPATVTRDKAGRFNGTIDLTDRQARFVKAYVRNGGRQEDACIEAGYSEVSARQIAYELTRLPHVQEAIKAEQARTIRGELASLAVKVVREILTDPLVKPGIRAELAIKVLDRAGHVAPKADTGDNKAKSLEDMSIAELEAFIREKETTLKPVGQAETVAPDQPPARPQTIELTAESTA